MNADHEARLGAPYNYKARLLEQMERRTADLRQAVALPQATPAVPATA